MTAKRKRVFDPKLFLATVDGGRALAKYRKSQIVFSQGDPAEAVFYVEDGKVKVTVVSDQGKQAVVAIHGKGDFFGEGALTGQPRRLPTVTALTDSAGVRLENAAIERVLPDEPKLSQLFWSYLLTRTARHEADLN